jgi:tRNA U55 pseudouridine synthase TruB
VLCATAGCPLATHPGMCVHARRDYRAAILKWAIPHRFNKHRKGRRIPVGMSVFFGTPFRVLRVPNFLYRAQTSSCGSQHLVWTVHDLHSHTACGILGLTRKITRAILFRSIFGYFKYTNKLLVADCNDLIIILSGNLKAADSALIYWKMSLVKSTTYAPDIYRALNGILLVCKPPRLRTKDLIIELRARITDSLNQYEPRPIEKRIVIEGEFDSEKNIVEKPNLADHPLVVGPRYLPWDLAMAAAQPHLGYRSSGLDVIMMGSANRYFRKKLLSHKLVSIYHITGRFGYMTNTCFYDGKITDKSNYGHIRSGKMDAVLSRIQTSQHDRIFDAAAVSIDSQEAYELAKEWPSRPPKMAKWPVIYRIRCIHLDLPVFKLEVTIVNEDEKTLAQIPHDVAQLLKTSAYTESIRRVKFGPFDINDSLTDKDWDLQSIIKHCYREDHKKLQDLIGQHRDSLVIRTEHAMPNVGKSKELIR